MQPEEEHSFHDENLGKAQEISMIQCRIKCSLRVIEETSSIYTFKDKGGRITTLSSKKSKVGNDYEEGRYIPMPE